jgi:tRNA modification GTPase
MYELNDTIVALSSPGSFRRVIIRLSGSDTVEKVERFFSAAIRSDTKAITHGKFRIADDFQIDAAVYFFASGHSYTCEDLAEIHFWSNPALTEEVLRLLISAGARHAQPGEFTARAYLNGRMDLAAAEAVNKVITSSNRLQLAAAEKLLSGRLTETTAAVSKDLLNILSLLEASLDFSEENIEFISREDAARRLQTAKQNLEKLLTGGISFEAVIDLPSVGIAGVPNAGKSSLLNCLLGRQRSIVCSESKTTRDVLTGILELEHTRCVLFDCAGLLLETESQIDTLAQAAAVEALAAADVVIFCVDASKENFDDDSAIRQLIKSETVIPVATKSDLLDVDSLTKQIQLLADIFAAEFLPLSNVTASGVDSLTKIIDLKISDQSVQGGQMYEARAAGVALTARHKQTVTDAIENISQAVTALEDSDEEVAAMMLRAACRCLSNLESDHIDEQILDNIFGQFCIGK